MRKNLRFLVSLTATALLLGAPLWAEDGAKTGKKVALPAEEASAAGAGEPARSGKAPDADSEAEVLLRSQKDAAARLRQRGSALIDLGTRIQKIPTRGFESDALDTTPLSEQLHGNMVGVFEILNALKESGQLGPEDLADGDALMKRLDELKKKRPRPATAGVPGTLLDEVKAGPALAVAPGAQSCSLEQKSCSTAAGAGTERK